MWTPIPSNVLQNKPTGYKHLRTDAEVKEKEGFFRDGRDLPMPSGSVAMS